VERGFCGKCGTSITYVAESRWPGQVSILAPTLDDPRIAVPSAHFDVQDRLPWIKLGDGLPVHDNSGKEHNMPKYSYACSDYPGMEKCPGRFYAATEGEIWKLIELHASIAHGENPAAWTENEKANLKKLIRPM
jgi:hypothetical protein